MNADMPSVTPLNVIPWGLTFAIVCIRQNLIASLLTVLIATSVKTASHPRIHHVVILTMKTSQLMTLKLMRTHSKKETSTPDKSQVALQPV